jgi:hypothetical protein
MTKEGNVERVMIWRATVLRNAPHNAPQPTQLS